jgi:hypothetical protein
MKHIVKKTIWSLKYYLGETNSFKASGHSGSPHKKKDAVSTMTKGANRIRNLHKTLSGCLKR